MHPPLLGADDQHVFLFIFLLLLLLKTSSFREAVVLPALQAGIRESNRYLMRFVIFNSGVDGKTITGGNLIEISVRKSGNGKI